MREIKFRGKRIDNEGWVYGDLFNASSGVTIIENGGSEGTDFSFVHLKSVGQYTGLKDKNGKEIYEGDIVACDKSEDGFQHISRIKFGWSIGDVYGFYWDSGYSLSRNDLIDERYSVIGNIHENPELVGEARG